MVAKGPKTPAQVHMGLAPLLSRLRTRLRAVARHPSAGAHPARSKVREPWAMNHDDPRIGAKEFLYNARHHAVHASAHQSSVQASVHRA